MKGKVAALAMGLLLMGFNLYAADGDFIVNGKLGIGTASPAAKLHVVSGGTARVLAGDGCFDAGASPLAPKMGMIYFLLPGGSSCYKLFILQR